MRSGYRTPGAPGGGGAARRLPEGVVGAPGPILEAKRKRLRAERARIPAGRKATKADRARRKELGQRLIMLHRILGYTIKKRGKQKHVPGFADTLKAELDRHRSSWAALAGAQLHLATIMSKIALETARLEQGDQEQKRIAGKELRRLKSQLKKARKAARKATKRTRTKLTVYAERGFLNLPKALVVAMKARGLGWGGDWRIHKDHMHFDLR